MKQVGYHEEVKGNKSMMSHCVASVPGSLAPSNSVLHWIDSAENEIGVWKSAGEQDNEVMPTRLFRAGNLF